MARMNTPAALALCHKPRHQQSGLAPDTKRAVLLKPHVPYSCYHAWLHLSWEASTVLPHHTERRRLTGSICSPNATPPIFLLPRLDAPVMKCQFRASLPHRGKMPDAKPTAREKASCLGSRPLQPQEAGAHSCTHTCMHAHTHTHASMHPRTHRRTHTCVCMS